MKEQTGIQTYESHTLTKLRLGIVNALKGTRENERGGEKKESKREWKKKWRKERGEGGGDGRGGAAAAAAVEEEEDEEECSNDNEEAEKDVQECKTYTKHIRNKYALTGNPIFWLMALKVKTEWEGTEYLV